ncbi:unnamed protein product [Agarophyton chilense]
MAAFVKAFIPRGNLPLFTRRQCAMPLVRARHVHRRARITMIRGFPNNFNNDFSHNSGDRRVFDELVDFPCVFTFKVIGMAQGDFMGDIVDSVATALETDKKYLKTSYRDKGKYRSITLKAPVNTAEQIYSVYAAIDRDPRVKFKF